MKRNAVIFMGKRSVAIAILLVITSTIFISVASAATTTYDYSSGATTNKWAWEVDSNDVPPNSVNSETALSGDQYVLIGTSDNNRWEMSDPGSNDFISMKSTIDIQESAASITNILFHVEGYKSGANPRPVAIYGYNQNTFVWDLIGSGDIPAGEPDGTVEASLTADFDNYIDGDGKMTWCFILNYKNRFLYVDYVKVEVTYTSISGVATDKFTYRVGETITTTWTSADGFGSGEDYINVEYWDVTAGEQFDLKSYGTSATSSTSKSLTSTEAGHTIAVYVYTTSSSGGDRSTAITQGDSWPYSILNPVEALITSCNAAGDEINEFAPGENVSVKAEGLEASTAYKIWLQDSQVNEGDSLIVGENPSSAVTPKEVNTDGSGNFVATLIWAIPSDAPITHHEYDIVVNKGTSEEGQTYNAADDGLDSATVAGIVAPVPDVSSLVLFASGLVLVSVYFVYGRKKKEDKRGR